MKLIKPTIPPSMAVVVDTIFFGIRTLKILEAHPQHPRIDVIYILDKMLRVRIGDPKSSPIVPKIPNNSRKLAEIYITPAIQLITNDNIWEVL